MAQCCLIVFLPRGPVRRVRDKSHLHEVWGVQRPNPPQACPSPSWAHHPSPRPRPAGCRLALAPARTRPLVGHLPLNLGFAPSANLLRGTCSWLPRDSHPADLPEQDGSWRDATHPSPPAREPLASLERPWGPFGGSSAPAAHILR